MHSITQSDLISVTSSSVVLNNSSESECLNPKFLLKLLMTVLSCQLDNIWN